MIARPCVDRCVNVNQHAEPADGEPPSGVIAVGPRVHREVELLAAAWAITCGDAVARLVIVTDMADLAGTLTTAPCRPLGL